MTNNNNAYKFGEQPPWEDVQSVLTKGGLGFWRIFTKTDGSVVFNPDDTLLAVVKAKRSDVPRELNKVLARYLYPEGARKLTKLIQACIRGEIENFEMKSTLLTEGDRQEIHVNIFASIKQKNENGQDFVISGFTQNIHELNEALNQSKFAAARTRMMVDGMPTPCDFWSSVDNNKNSGNAVMPLSIFSTGLDKIIKVNNINMTILDTNKAALETFDMPNKETYLRNFHKLSPKFQPNGRLTEQMIPELGNKALAEGRITFDWMHQKIDGTPIPCEVTLVIMKYDAGYAAVSYTKDLRESKAAQAKLDMALKDKRAADKRSSLMINAMPFGCEFWDTNPHNTGPSKAVGPLSELQGKYAYLTDVNKAALDVFGIPDKPSYINSFYTLSPEFQPNGQSSKDMLVKRLNEAISTGHITFAWENQATDGTPIPCEITLIRVPYGNGLTIIGYKRDLRVLKSAQTKLDAALVENKAATERIRTMVDSLPIICNFWDTTHCHQSPAKTKVSLIGLQDKKACLIDANQAAMTIFGFPDRQSYMDNFERLSPEFQPNGISSQKMSRELMSSVFCTGKTQVFEWMHQKFDETPVPCEVTLVRVSQGDEYTMVGYMRDLRELKAAQSAMLMERLLLEKIMDTMPVCFIITVNDMIKFITPFAKEFTGCNIGDNISNIYTSAQAYIENKEKQEKNILLSWYQVKIKRPDGTISSMLLNTFKVDYYGEVGIMSWFIDITEMHKKNEELRHARKIAEESTRAKSNFLANMSHEIRTPMNAILGLLHLLVQSDLGFTQREYLTKTEGAAKALLRIINDILDFSKIEAGKLEMENEVFYLDEVLQNVTDLASSRIHEKALEYVVHVQPDTPTGLIGDQVRLVQILSNLVSNAAKFTKEGQILVKVEIVSKNETEVTLRCLVQDTGIGLKKKQVKSLFSAFTQADTSTTRRYGGTGLGLVICKRLVEMMNGSIWVESEYGKGSTFGFTATFGIHTGSLKNDFKTTNDFQGFSALIIDDNVVALDCLSIFLKSIGLEVQKATSGQEALDILADCDKNDKYFDLIFIDWKMPSMDGIETTLQINQLISPSKLPVIIMVTAYNRDEVLSLSKNAGIKTILTKPVSPSTIVNMLGNIFGGMDPVPKKKNDVHIGQEQDMVKDFAGARILLVEDNEINQLVASRILENAGLKIDIAKNGKEAVSMAKAGKYELILMDIQMPEMDGMEATRILRTISKFKDLPILAMTANAMSGDREMSIAAGMDDHISKPIDLYEMFLTLQKWLKRSRKLYKK